MKKNLFWALSLMLLLILVLTGCDGKGRDRKGVELINPQSVWGMDENDGNLFQADGNTCDCTLISPPAGIGVRGTESANSKILSVVPKDNFEIKLCVTFSEPQITKWNGHTFLSVWYYIPAGSSIKSFKVFSFDIVEGFSVTRDATNFRIGSWNQIVAPIPGSWRWLDASKTYNLYFDFMGATGTFYLNGVDVGDVSF